MKKREPFLKFLDQRIEQFGAQYRNFGFFGAINFSLSYFLMSYYLGTNEAVMPRLIAFLLCLPLAFVDYWSARAKKYLNIYWVLTLLCCFSVFGTYLFLDNHLSAGWALNFSVGLFWLILLVDWSVFSVLLSIGVPLGYLLFTLSGKTLVIKPDVVGISLALCLHTYIYALLIGVIFGRSREKTTKDRLHAMKMVAGAVAHELRTPLGAITMIAHTLAARLPIYQKGYNKAVEANLLADELTPEQKHYIARTPKSLNSLIKSSHIVINMLLANLKENMTDHPLAIYSMKACVEEALQTYPFSAADRPRVHWDDTHAFSFRGRQELAKHIFFNLLKNALYAIAQKGEIFIYLEPGVLVNKVIFKDTGKGISSKDLPHIFTRFYSRDTNHGTGIGLAFCDSVMKSFGGSIECDSVKGQYTTFTLSFPALV
jgi:signal transduction histidine kinase